MQRRSWKSKPTQAKPMRRSSTSEPDPWRTVHIRTDISILLAPAPFTSLNTVERRELYPNCFFNGVLAFSFLGFTKTLRITMETDESQLSSIVSLYSLSTGDAGKRERDMKRVGSAVLQTIITNLITILSLSLMEQEG